VRLLVKEGWDGGRSESEDSPLRPKRREGGLKSRPYTKAKRKSRRKSKDEKKEKDRKKE